jgi:tetratricopeptide (TPR) repeat protein
MDTHLVADEDLVRRLPLPLAQLYRLAHNEAEAWKRHQAAYYLWEAALKLLACTAIADYAGRAIRGAEVADSLRYLPRPSTGHWWSFVRVLIPRLAAFEDPGFVAVRRVLEDRELYLDRAEGLVAALLDQQPGIDKKSIRKLPLGHRLFSLMVPYRNRAIGHAAAGMGSQDDYQRMGKAILLGISEFLGRLDVLAGRRLVHVSEVEREPSGLWLVRRLALVGEAAKGLEPVRMRSPQPDSLPHPQRLYLECGVCADGDLPSMVSLFPLVLFDWGAHKVFFFNSKDRKQPADYLCYTTNELMAGEDLAGERRVLLTEVLGVAPDLEPEVLGEEQAEEGQERSSGADESAPRRLGEFELLGTLGWGGMGVVYRAGQPSLRRDVAVKCLRQAGDARSEARFSREIRVLGMVDHPHLVKVYTSGVAGEEWYYAMELVEGATLAAVCEVLGARRTRPAELDMTAWREALATACERSRQQERPMGAGAPIGARPRVRVTAESPMSALVAGRGYIQHVVELIRQAAEAAHAIHEAKAVHRDIKPGNIMVSPDGSHATLMDLGLAQLADEVEGRVTRTRQFVGTLRYASPEQVLAVGRIDRRSDVYSLGATLWEILTLEPIYGATEATPTPELMDRIMYAEPAPIRRRCPRASRDLEAVAQKCLEKEPARRYATAQELAQDLRDVLGGKRVRIPRVTSAERFWRWCRHHPAVAGLSAAVGLSLVAGTAISVHYALRARAGEQGALERTKHARALSDVLGREAAQTSFNNGLYLDTVEKYDAAIAAFGDAIRFDPGYAEAYNQRGFVHDEKKEYDAAIADLSRAIELKPNYAEAYRNRGDTYNDKKEYDKAIADLGRAIEIAPEDPITFYLRGESLRSLKEYDRALADYTKAIELDPKVKEGDGYWGRARAWYGKKEYDKAIADLDKALEYDPKFADYYDWRGDAWRATKEYDRAIADYTQAIRLEPKSATYYNDRGNTWLDKKQYDKAISDYDDAIRNDPKSAVYLSNCGNTWLAEKEYDKAMADSNRAIELDPKYANAYNNRGNVSRAKKEYGKAIADYDEAIRIDPTDARPSYNRAATLFLTSRDGAVSGAKAALDVEGWRGNLSTYAVLLSHFAARRAGQEGQAKAFLEEAARRCDPSRWPYPIVKYLRGDLDESKLLAAANDEGKMTDVQCYVGLDLLQKGQRTLALEHFRWVKEHGDPRFTQYAIGDYELEHSEGRRPGALVP